MITVAKVMKINNDLHIKCKQQKGLDGSLWFRDMQGGEKETTESISSVYKTGTVFEARVKSIDYIQFKVDLMKKQKDMLDHKEYLPNIVSIQSFFELTDEDRLNIPYINAHSQKIENINLETLDMINLEILLILIVVIT